MEWVGDATGGDQRGVHVAGRRYWYPAGVVKRLTGGACRLALAWSEVSQFP
jgi:hypothetical protein